ncbi:MAG: cobalamin-binding protein [Chloroflexi bacterium]|nr:cobalamin-binding protein [Chloroflexota bacterium]
MRIVSLLPSATEIVAALGLANQLVGISHECDYPPEVVAGKPILTRSAIPPGLSQSEIDATVAERLKRGESLYLLDEDLLNELQPDLILTQELCTVCAVSFATVRDAACKLASDPRVVSLEPTNLAGILENIRTVGELTRTADRAEKFIASLQQRLDAIQEKTRHVSHRPRAYAMEWLNPPYNAGHWVPEMVSLAGGVEVLGRIGEPSARLTWEQVIASQPECIILMPCGYTVAMIQKEIATIPFPDGWWGIPAVRNGNLFAVNATAYFSRPGPRVVEGVELLASLFHPQLFSAPSHENAERIELTRAIV